MISPCAFPLLLAALVWLPGTAAPLYKWTDSTGRVTYASTPPAGVKAAQVAVPPSPSAEDVRQAEARLKRMQEQLTVMEDARRAQEAEEARLRALRPPAPIVIEKPVYMPQPAIYAPALIPLRGRHPPKPERPEQHRPR